MVTSPAEAMARREPFEFGQVTVAFHGLDAVLHGPGTGKPESVVDGTSAAVRQWVRFDNAEMYRPLPGARTMRTDWCAHLSGTERLPCALDAIYPLALRHSEQWRAGTLRVVRLDEVLERQSGRYEGSSRLSDGGRRAASDVLCGQCVKTPVWRGDTPEGSTLVCPEPCGVLVALCREAVAWEAAPPPSAPVNPGIRFAQFEVPGNQVREAFLASHPDPPAFGTGETGNRARRS